MNTVTITVASTNIEISKDAAIKLGRALLVAGDVDIMTKPGWNYVSGGNPVEVGWYDILYRWESVEEWSAFGATRIFWDGSYWLQREGGYKVAFGNDDCDGERYRRSGV